MKRVPQSRQNHGSHWNYQNGLLDQDFIKTKVVYLLLPESKEWDIVKIRAMLPNHEREILDIKVSKLGAPDTWTWLPTEDGIYKARSGRSIPRNTPKRLQLEM